MTGDKGLHGASTAPNMNNLSRANILNSKAKVSGVLNLNTDRSNINPEKLKELQSAQLEQVQKLFTIMQAQVQKQREEMLSVAKNLKPDEKCP